ncbi:MAG: hypothetical protein KatS3mg002_1452 [Candidatus Woesearchaeota archaeon]|nr:MAG: hypothetical protein KatS3mg002_1452 [Candidatus Woesearchaeota archaeon]
MRFKKLFRNWKIWVLLLSLLFSLIALHPNPWASGVAIRSVVKDSPAYLAGISNPSPNAPPMSREVITAINNVPIKNINDYNSFISGLVPNSTITIKTNKDMYRVQIVPKYEVIFLNETELETYVEEVTNGTEVLNVTKNTIGK